MTPTLLKKKKKIFSIRRSLKRYNFYTNIVYVKKCCKALVFLFTLENRNFYTASALWSGTGLARPIERIRRQLGSRSAKRTRFHLFSLTSSWRPGLNRSPFP